MDDIQDDTHKNFLKEYIRSWPYPPQTQYKIGQIINAKLNGSQQRCEVLAVDCSLIQVAFEVSVCKPHCSNCFQLDSCFFLTMFLILS